MLLRRLLICLDRAPSFLEQSIPELAEVKLLIGARSKVIASEGIQDTHEDFTLAHYKPKV
ncbi:hypothetical protein DVK00_19220 [Haloarcula sp. Atlit-47R]|nr:hypothetical protein DVK00_19220 [Haloarcula sp. Atlit-47R]